MKKEKERRKALSEAYRERSPEVGILALYCAATDQTFLAPSLDLRADSNSYLFKVQSGTHPNKALVSLYKEHADSFEVKVLEQLDYETFDRDVLNEKLKIRLQHYLDSIPNSAPIWKFF